MLSDTSRLEDLRRDAQLSVREVRTAHDGSAPAGFVDHRFRPTLSLCVRSLTLQRGLGRVGDHAEHTYLCGPLQLQHEHPSKSSMQNVRECITPTAGRSSSSVRLIKSISTGWFVVGLRSAGLPTLCSINIQHISNSIRTHGTGIMNTTVCRSSSDPSS